MTTNTHAHPHIQQTLAVTRREKKKKRQKSQEFMSEAVASSGGCGDGDGVKVRVLLIGQFGSGKSTLVRVFASGKPLVLKDGTVESTPPPLPEGVQASTPSVIKDLVVDGHDIRLFLVDTAGEERFSTVSCSLYRGQSARPSALAAPRLTRARTHTRTHRSECGDCSVRRHRCAQL
jgi:hypothetical protein